MKILVTGGAGYIGSHTCVELINNGHEVAVLDNFYNSSEGSIKRVEKITGKQVKLYGGDVRDRTLLTRIFDENKIDCVIHLAGLKAGNESCANPILYYDNNIGETLALVDIMARHNCKKIVFSSSSAVYGEPEVLPITEECKTCGQDNPYVTSKLYQEKILSDMYVADKNWTVVLLRHFNPIGAHGSGLIGEDIKGNPHNLISCVAKVAKGELSEVGVFGSDYPTPDGTGVRDYIHVVDLAKGHVAAVEKVTDTGVHIYNLGSGTGYSVLDVIHAFERACGRRIPFAIKPRRPGDVAARYADVSKAKKELGWKAELSLDEMCSSMWKWLVLNPNGYKKKF